MIKSMTGFGAGDCENQDFKVHVELKTVNQRYLETNFHMPYSLNMFENQLFKDMSNGDMFLSRSTAKTNDTVEFEGETYPVVKIEISSTSHPFYTGKSKLVDTAGRVDKFMSRYGKAAKK